MASTVFKRILPTLNRVVIRKLEPQTKTASGIILQKSDTTNSFGTVIEVGPGLLNEEGKPIKLSVNVGDTVLLPDYGGVKVKLDNQELHLYKDSDILAIMK
jgi:chaperonin GroES